MRNRVAAYLVTVIIVVLSFAGYKALNVVNASDTCTITFDLNGGYTESGPLKDASYDSYQRVVNINDTIYTPLSEPVYDNNAKLFDGWSDIEEDHSIYTSSQIRNMTFNTDKTFVAVWIDSINVTFLANEGEFEEKDGETSTIVSYQWKQRRSMTYYTNYGKFEHSNLNNGKKIVGTMTKGKSIGESHLDYYPYMEDDSYLFIGYTSRNTGNFYYKKKSIYDNNPDSISNYVPTSDEVFDAVWKKSVNISFKTDSDKGYFTESPWPGQTEKVSEISKLIATEESIRDWWPTINLSDIEPTAKDEDSYIFEGWKKENDNKIYTSSEVLSMDYIDDTMFTAQWKQISENNDDTTGIGGDGTYPTNSDDIDLPDESQLNAFTLIGKKSNNTAKSIGTKKSTNSQTKTTPKYAKEWRNGKWYDSNGNTSYSGGKWKSNATGWWFEDASGWYPVSQWVKINGTWYYFKADGYMATSQYIGGYWVDANGACQ